jgi:hypothetical protein
MNARLVGVRKKKAEAAEKEEKKWGTFLCVFLLTSDDELPCHFALECNYLFMNRWIIGLLKHHVFKLRGSYVSKCVISFIMQSVITS